jgi:hypothetical protein
MCSISYLPVSKLSHGVEVEKELVQVAIYRKLLQVERRGFAYRGCLEYFLPDLLTQEIGQDDLDAIYEKWVTPTFPQLLGRGVMQPRGTASEAQVPSTAEIQPKGSEGKTAQSSSTVESGAGFEHAPPPQADPFIASTNAYLGETRGLRPEPCTIEISNLTRHAAFLGGTGSGKTTLALNILEQVLAAQIPVILVDRKGDLCRYADPHAWLESGNADEDKRRNALREKIDVSLFTPGHVGGRSLSISAVPVGLSELPEHEQSQLAKDAATSIASMLRMRPTEVSQVAILAQAIRLLAESQPTQSATISDLTQFIHDSDPVLIKAIGVIDPKQCGKLAQKLQTFELMQGQLLDSSCEKLRADLLLGRGAFGARGGRTRLSIISTKFLGDKETLLFWVAQLLVELGRYASRHPSREPQAMVLFDEADMYLPAISKPATKEPMENLLRRARSAGIGVMLGTQSPGDFDYKCRENVRSWFIGLVQQPVALEKLKPMLQESSIALDKISKQSVGQFHVLTEGLPPLSIQARRNLIKTEQLSESRIVELARMQERS